MSLLALWIKRFAIPLGIGGVSGLLFLNRVSTDESGHCVATAQMVARLLKSNL